MVEDRAGAVPLVDVDQVVGGFRELEETVAELLLLLGGGALDDAQEVLDDAEVRRRRVARHAHQLAARAERLLGRGLEEPVRRDHQRVRILRNRFIGEHLLEVVTGLQDDRPVLRVGGILDDFEFLHHLLIGDQAEDAPVGRAELTESRRVDLDCHNRRYPQVADYLAARKPHPVNPAQYAGG
ncbi:hypothetical protein [Streptomyces abikoensis]